MSWWRRLVRRLRPAVEDTEIAEIVVNDVHGALAWIEREHHVVTYDDAHLFTEFYEIYTRQHESERHTKTHSFKGALDGFTLAIAAIGGLRVSSNAYWVRWDNFDEDHALRWATKRLVRVYLNPHSESLRDVASFIDALARQASLRGWLFRGKHTKNATEETLRRADKIVLYIPDENDCFEWVVAALRALPDDVFVRDTPLFIRTIRPGVGYVAAGERDEEVTENQFRTYGYSSESYGQYVSYEFIDAFREYMRRHDTKSVSIWELPRDERERLETFLAQRILRGLGKRAVPTQRT